MINSILSFNHWLHYQQTTLVFFPDLFQTYFQTFVILLLEKLLPFFSYFPQHSFSSVFFFPFTLKLFVAVNHKNLFPNTFFSIYFLSFFVPCSIVTDSLSCFFLLLFYRLKSNLHNVNCSSFVWFICCCFVKCILVV